MERYTGNYSGTTADITIIKNNQSTKMQDFKFDPIYNLLAPP